MFFILGCIVIAYAIGAATVHFRVFPYPQIREAVAALKYETERLHWGHFRYDRKAPVEQHDPQVMMPGLTLVSGFTDSDDRIVRIVDATGREVYRWRINWSELWPDPPHLDPEDIDEGQEHVQGVALLPDGDLVFNYTERGMFRLSPCGGIVWRLPKETHHSLYVDDDGDFWVPGQIAHLERSSDFPAHKPFFLEFTILEVSPDGKILREISVPELLEKNGLKALLYLSTIDNSNMTVRGDTLHLNDVEVFPETLPEGIFRHGDVMISLRNINTVLVFDPETLKIRFVSTGRVLRQHDPDFLDGDTISIFDNNNLLDDWFDNSSGERLSQGLQSRIAVLDARQDRVTRVFEGRGESRFFSDIIGTHQYLDNGNMLITESRAGRAFEVTPDGRLVWEYFNIIAPGTLGVIDDAQRLPRRFDAAFFEARRAECAGE
ncbi:arylsulfotransferase family protein [Maritimibacter sp. 55A14]|uniref:arylsulfotransferase family protein n=1 Tax=Maritimibacter sp. 55A14 TaxID=2174844 RepID=UPI001304EFD4|nr:arylsulfotransferase family protein [Maritimibacter sp. 55A14]